MTDDPVLRALELGKERIRRGWTQSGRYEYHGRVCMLGALCRTETGHITSVQWKASAYLELAVRASTRGDYGLCFDSVSWFNDSPRVKKRHVLGAFDWAAELRRIDLAKGGTG